MFYVFLNSAYFLFLVSLNFQFFNFLFFISFILVIISPLIVTHPLFPIYFGYPSFFFPLTVSRSLIRFLIHLFFLLLIEGIPFFVLIVIIAYFHSFFVLILFHLLKIIIQLTVSYFTNRSTVFHSVTEHPYICSSSMTVQSPSNNQQN